MKPNDPWQKLVAAAARVQPDADVQAPIGFSTRIVARADLGAKAPLFGNAFARFSWPALGVASLAAIIAVATNLKPVMASLSEDVAALADPVTEADTSA